MKLTTRQKEALDGYLFISPWIIGFIIFVLGPMIMALVLSFYNWEIVRDPSFVGLRNYARLASDPLVWKSLLNTVYYTVIGVPLRICLALCLAVLLNHPGFLTNVFRMVFYLPSITSGVAVAVVWTWLYEPYFGVINSLLRVVGIDGPGWLSSPDWAMPALIIMGLVYIGQPMVVFIAGLKGIPPELYEASSLDGATWWRQFVNITIPMLSPTIFFNLIMQLIASFQVFTNAYVMTEGGPVNATLVYVLYLYQNAFLWLRMGYGAALAWLLFAIVFVLTYIQFKNSGWVHYEGMGGN